jgi:hypothetical protein
MTPEEYLNSIGIELEKTTLVVNIDGINRQPDLCKLMEDYSNLKISAICETLKSPICQQINDKTT